MNNFNNKKSSTVPFQTVLVARKPTDPPCGKFSILLSGKYSAIYLHLTHPSTYIHIFLSKIKELEIVLRQWTNKIRCVGGSSSCSVMAGSHYLIPGKESIAIRVYFPQDIEKRELEYQSSCKKKYSQQSCTQEEVERQERIKYLLKLGGIEKSSHPPIEAISPLNQKTGTSTMKDNTKNEDDEDDDIDNICTFRDSFKHAVVFFVLPSGSKVEQQQIIENANSFCMRIQRKLFPSSLQKRAPTISTTKTLKKKMIQAKVFIVPDVNIIIHTLNSLMESIKEEKLVLKRRFFEKEQLKYGIYYHNPASLNTNTNMTTTATQDYIEKKTQSEKLYAVHVAQAFCGFVNTQLKNNENRGEGFQCGDANILLSVLKSIGSITGQNEQSMKDLLVNVPISQSSKDSFMNFFFSSSSGSQEHPQDRYHSTNSNVWEDVQHAPPLQDRTNHHSMTKNKEQQQYINPNYSINNDVMHFNHPHHGNNITTEQQQQQTLLQEQEQNENIPTTIQFPTPHLPTRNPPTHSDTSISSRSPLGTGRLFPNDNNRNSMFHSIPSSSRAGFSSRNHNHSLSSVTSSNINNSRSPFVRQFHNANNVNGNNTFFMSSQQPPTQPRPSTTVTHTKPPFQKSRQMNANNTNDLNLNPPYISSSPLSLFSSQYNQLHQTQSQQQQTTHHPNTNTFNNMNHHHRHQFLQATPMSQQHILPLDRPIITTTDNYVSPFVHERKIQQQKRQRLTRTPYNQYQNIGKFSSNVKNN